MNLESLRHYWYPVACADELGDQPLAVTLLDEQIVLFRSGERLGACLDLCIHRGSQLSRGWIEDGCLVCAYHAWAYDADGRCVRIPSLPDGAPIPAKARVPGFQVAERYGLIWVCLGTPRAPIPPFPEYDDPSFEKHFAGAYVWQAHATRMVENFMDLAHLPWVHPSILGERTHPYVPPVKVDLLDDGLYFDYSLLSPENGADLQGTGGLELSQRLYFPFTIGQNRTWDGNHLKLFFTVQPIGLKSARRYLWAVRRGRFDAPLGKMQAVLDNIREQDKAVVEYQRPELLPVDLSAEMHLQGSDAAALAYRKLLARAGVEPEPLVESEPALHGGDG